MGQSIQNKLNKRQFQFEFTAAFATEIDIFWKLN